MRKSTLVLGLLVLGNALLGARACQPPGPLAPLPGLPEYQEPLLVPVPGAAVNAAGNDLRVMREDLSLDTRIGGLSLGAVYDDAAAGWLWSFQTTYDGATLLDPSGARLSSMGLSPGDAIPGTWWVVLGPDAVKTKGGLVHRFGADGRLEAVYWASDPYPRVETRSQEVAGAQRITELQQCTAPGACSRIVKILYDALGRIREIQDTHGRRAQFSWDAEGRLVVARDPVDVARSRPGFRYAYDGARLSALTNSEGERVEFSRSGDVLEVRAVGAGTENPTWRFERLGAEDQVWSTRLTDPLGNVRTLYYDRSRRLLRAVDPLGDTVEWAWEGQRPVERREPDGRTTRWVIAGDDPVEEIQPGGNVVQLSYAPEAVDRGAPRQRPRLRVEDSLGVLEERSYDAAGRLVAIRNGAGETTTLAYDTSGMLAGLTAPDGSTLGFADYGDHGHAQSLVVDGQTYPRSFDAVGNLLQRSAVEADEPGVISRAYDADRRVVSVQLVEQIQGSALYPKTISLDLRSDGRPLAVTRPGPDAQYVYDALGRLVERRDRIGGAWRSTRFEWDAAGRLTALERPDGLRAEQAYDAAGRPVLQLFGRGAPFVAELAAAYTWQAGRLVEVWDGVHAAPEQHQYDASGRLAEVIYPEGETLVPQWDARGRLRGLDLADGAAFAAHLGVDYDGMGRETGISLDGTLLEQRTFAAGHLAQVRYGNGLVRSLAWGSPLDQSSETRDAGGNLVAQTRLVETSPETPLCVDLEVESFVGLQAQAAEHHCLGQAQRTTDGFEFWDALGNAAWGGYDSDFVYGPDGALLEIGAGHTYAYDEAGYASERDGAALTYDAAGRPTAVGSDYAFAWDALGRPVSETTPQGTTRRRFGGLVEGDATGAPRALDLGSLRVDLVGGAHRYRHLDPRGNVAFVSDAAGAVRTLYRYDDFGVAAVRGADDDPVRFARGRQVGELVLLGRRLLDPAVGRFLSPDPVYQLQSQYTYAWGNPVFFWDPGGLEGTLHGFTAHQLSAAFAFAAAGTAPYAVLGGPASLAIPATSVFLAAWLDAIDSAGGFPWEGDRAVWEIGRAVERGARDDDSVPGPSGPKRDAIEGSPTPSLPSFPNGMALPTCAPTRVRAGGRSSALWTLACVNLCLGAALVQRARRTRS